MRPPTTALPEAKDASQADHSGDAEANGNLLTRVQALVLVLCLGGDGFGVSECS